MGSDTEVRLVGHAPKMAGPGAFRGVTARVTFSLVNDLQQLQTHLAGFGRVLLGYSGGVDSALLAVAGARALGPDRFLAVLGRSPSVPAAQVEAARALALAHGVPLHELDTQELDDPAYRANPENRCYFCKRELWSRLTAVAAARGFDVVIDGTNADDLADHRPGVRAADERQVRSPLADLGWTKARIRTLSRELGLATWDQPAAPCLASRIRYGLEVTPARLQQVEAGEAFLRTLGVAGDLRVRHHDAAARIEVQPEAMPRVQAAWEQVETTFRQLGFAAVTLDPRGYRRGALLQLLQGAD
jgi:uncharacterized protein